MKAVLVGPSSVEVVDQPIPTVGAGEVLIKNVVAASNPADWKIPAFFGGPPSVQGSDAAGYVEAVGEGVSEFVLGDRVAAFSSPVGGDRAGAYAEYTISPAHTVFKLGPEVKFEDAVTLPVAFSTASIALLRHGGLGLDDDLASQELPKSADAGKKQAVLIYSASSSTGGAAVQLAKKLGLYVVAVAGASAEVAKTYGADVVLDYRSSNLEEELTAAVKEHNIRSALDTAGNKDSYAVISHALDANGGGTLASLQPPPAGFAVPSSVKHSFSNVVTAHTDDAVKPFAKKYLTLLGEWLEKGEFKSHKVTIVPGGLAGVEEGLQRLREGKVNGEKLVYVIADTPGLE